MEIEDKRTNSRLRRIVVSFVSAIKSFCMVLPMIIGVVLLLGLFKIYITPQMITSVFTGELFRDTILGSAFGSILTGNPITSYIIGGELLRDGISLFAVTAFIVAWVTVGIVQLPAEAAILGKRFALARNGISFILSILISLVTVLTFEVIS